MAEPKAPKLAVGEPASPKGSPYTSARSAWNRDNTEGYLARFTRGPITNERDVQRQLVDREMQAQREMARKLRRPTRLRGDRQQSSRTVR